MDYIPEAIQSHIDDLVKTINKLNKERNKLTAENKAQAKQLILSGVVASLPDEEKIYVSHGSDGDDDVYCAFTDLSKAEKDCEEAGSSLTAISLYRK